MTKATIPDYIYLQVFGSEDPQDIEDDEPLSEITWSESAAWEHDVRYIRADKALTEIARLRNVLKSLSDAMGVVEQERRAAGRDIQAAQWHAFQNVIDRQIYNAVDFNPKTAEGQ